MNLNVLLSVPIIAFSLFALIAEVLGFELVFHRSRISLARSETTLDRMSIQTMLLSTVVYAGSIASTSGITLVESLTWLRPGNAMAPLLGYVFGIPGCVGVGLGNLLADSFSGYFTHASLGGFLANFMLAYIPHKVLSDPPLRRVKEVAGYLLFVVLISTFVSGYVIVGLFDLVSRAGFTNPIPVIGGIPPPR